MVCVSGGSEGTNRVGRADSQKVCSAEELGGSSDGAKPLVAASVFADAVVAAAFVVPEGDVQ